MSKPDPRPGQLIVGGTVAILLLVALGLWALADWMSPHHDSHFAGVGTRALLYEAESKGAALILSPQVIEDYGPDGLVIGEQLAVVAWEGEMIEPWGERADGAIEEGRVYAVMRDEERGWEIRDTGIRRSVDELRSTQENIARDESPSWAKTWLTPNGP